MARLYFWLWFVLVWLGWVGSGWYVHISYRIVSGLCLARKRRETRLQSPHRFVLCDHHYLRFAASFYGVRVKREEGGPKGGSAGEGVDASQRCRRIAGIAASSYYNLPKTSTVFQYSTLRDGPKKKLRDTHTHTHTRRRCLFEGCCEISLLGLFRLGGLW